MVWWRAGRRTPPVYRVYSAEVAGPSGAGVGDARLDPGIALRLPEVWLRASARVRARRCNDSAPRR